MWMMAEEKRMVVVVMVVGVEDEGEWLWRPLPVCGILLLLLHMPLQGFDVHVRVHARSCSRSVVVVVAAADTTDADPIAPTAGNLRTDTGCRFFRGRRSAPVHIWERLGLEEEMVAVGWIAMFLLERRRVGGSGEGCGSCSCCYCCCWRRGA